MDKDIAYNHVSDKSMFMMLTKSKVYDFNILLILTISQTWYSKKNNGNAIIMKCYVKVWISVWC